MPFAAAILLTALITTSPTVGQADKEASGSDINLIKFKYYILCIAKYNKKQYDVQYSVMLYVTLYASVICNIII